jgi:hypothetical protein
VRLSFAHLTVAIVAMGCAAWPSCAQPIQKVPRRIVILKVDGLGANFLYSAMRSMDPGTGRPKLPWLAHIFLENGTIFENFYTRGISLSAPSWSMLDTGRHTVIRGNVEYDRYTGEVYDYLNFFPFYWSYARSRKVDMPGVEVLDRAGIPLVIDRFRYAQVYQDFQLFQRGVRWTTLKRTLVRRFSSKALLSVIESGALPSLDTVLRKQVEIELEAKLGDPGVLYLDWFSGDLDHEGHATNDPAALFDSLKHLDAVAGRIWTRIQNSPMVHETVMVLVSDHGMNNAPGIVSQSFSLPDLLNSPAGGAHHVVTNRVQLSEYKLRGLNPLVHREITPSTASFYLKGEASRYPTAWLDLDGNERAAIHLRNSDLNQIQILLQQLSRSDLRPSIRRAAVAYLHELIETHRAKWGNIVTELTEELAALQQAIVERRALLAAEPKKWTADQREQGKDKAARRLNDELEDWQSEHSAYTTYLSHLRSLLALNPGSEHPLPEASFEMVPSFALGDNNTVAELRHYVIGPGPLGLVLDTTGRVDEDESFRHVNYFELFAKQYVRNNPQPKLSRRPIDFLMMPLPDGPFLPQSDAAHMYWLYGDDRSQLIIQTGRTGSISLRPMQNLKQDKDGRISAQDQPWRAGLPLHLFEDPDLKLPEGTAAEDWLSSWHTEREWFEATHKCRYSNGVIGVIEELSPVQDNVPGPNGISPILLRFERRRRELVQADFHVFAADHWNFNTRFPNPGGNHGSFLRISTHSVWMLAGAGVPVGTIEEPYDSLNFASTLLHLLDFPAPMPDRIVNLDQSRGSIP